MNQTCDVKGIKREFIVARTPQQNGVTKKKNITLIEAARTMLVDFKLPTTFWAEAVNTACYVLNRALVIKPHNKTPYELIRGRPPLIDFINPLGDLIVEETLNIRFLKNAPNVKVNGPDWPFDIDSLTISLNFMPVVAWFQTNGIARTKDNIIAGQTEKKKEPKQEYILIPICTTDPLISRGSKDSAVDAGKKATEVDESQVSDNGWQDDQVTRSEFEGILQQERQTEHINSTNSFNTEHPFERFSSFKNSFSLPHVPIVTPINDTGIFGNAYDDEVVEEEVNMNNVVSSYTIPDAPLTKFLKDHPKDQIASTPMEPNKALIKHAEAEDVDVHLYKLMIGLLMYLIASRLDITFAVCAYTRFQVTPKTSHLHAVKRIFRYLKGQPKLGLWYPRDSPLDLEAYSDSDYAGASLTGNLQQEVVNFLVLWIQNQLLDYGFNLMNTTIYIDNESTICIVKNPVFHSKTKHIEIRHHFIRDSYEKKLIQVIKIHTDHNVADLLTKAFDVSSGPTNLVADKTVYKEWEDRIKKAATTASSLEAEQDSSNINKTQSMATLNEPLPQGIGSGSGLRCQVTILGVQKLKLASEKAVRPKLEPFGYQSPILMEVVNFLAKGFHSNVKKQSIVANSTTEAEYDAAASRCGYVLWIQNQMLDYGFNLMNTKIYIDNETEETVYKEWEDRMERAATTTSSLEAEQDSATKDETSRILKTFIIGIENQLDCKVKVIRCDNGTEFKNSVMNQFYDMKGIKREFSVARTPQQNNVAERKNRTLIEAARTMLVDSKLPTTFWAEAVNTAFYVLNRALVIKPHNKTSYKLIRGRPPLIDFMKPFRCLVTILNTRDYLGKFDEKANEGFFVGYSVVSKAMRVFNKRTRIVEKTLNIRFLKNAPNVKGNRQDQLFDIDSLTISMNYVPVVAGFQTNDNGRQDDQVNRSEFEGLLQQEGQSEHINNTNSFNTFSSPINTARPSFVNAASPSPINAVKTPASTNAFEEHPFERLSPFKNAFSLPHVAIVTIINDTGIFGNAYDDGAVEEEVDMNNVVSSYTIPNGPLTKFLNDHPKDQVIGSIKTPVPKRQMTKINEEHVARIEAIRLLLANASFKDFVVYQMDVKSDFLYEKIEKEVYICQSPGFEDPDFLEKVYEVEKALYGLHQALRACQDKYVADILKEFDFSTIKIASTPMKPNKALPRMKRLKMFQVTPNTSHLYAVKRIFRYLKGQPKLGLGYPKDSPFDLKAYYNSDYAGASLDRKSTTREYVAAASCCGHVLWIQNQMLDYGFNLMNTKIYIDNENETVYKEWEDIMERATATASSLEAKHDSGNINRTQSMATLNELFLREPVQVVVLEKPFESEGFKQIIDFLNATPIRYTLTVNPIVYASCVKQILTTAKVKKVNGQEHIQALIDKQKVIITEESIRRDLQFDDAEATACLPNDTIFEELARIGFLQVFLDKQVEGMAKHKEIYVISSHTKKVFEVDDGSGIHTNSHHTPTDTQPSLFKPQKNIVPKRKQRQATEVYSPSSEIPVEESIPTPSNDLLPSGEDSIQLNEFMIFCSNLQQQVLDLEEAKTTQAKEIYNLKKRVKKLEKRRKSRPAGLRRLKKGRSIKDNNQDAEIALVYKAQGMMHDAYMFRVDDLEGNEVIIDVIEKIVGKEVSTADPVTTAGEVVTAANFEDSTAPTTVTTADVDDELTLTKTLIAINAAKPKVISTAVTTVTTAITTPRAKGIVFHEQVQAHTPTVSLLKDKGKAKMIDTKKPLKKKDQIALDEEVARKQLAEQIQAQEREHLPIEERSKLLSELIESRRKYFAAKRAEVIKNKPPTKAHQKSLKCTYMKNMEGFKQKDFKGKSFDDIKKIFNKVYKRVNTFVDINTENVEESFKKTQAEVTKGSSKRAGEEIEQESAKKQKLDEQIQVEGVNNDIAELKRCLEIVPEDDDDVAIEATPLSSKSPTIVDYKIYREGKKSYFKIIRADGNSQNYLTFGTMFKNFNREDLEVLRSIVKERFKKTKPVDDMENLLFQTLKTILSIMLKTSYENINKEQSKLIIGNFLTHVEYIVLQQRIWCIISRLRRCTHLQIMYYINCEKM
nr:retrovirus-related Pol polyprotein from transposon TNT 1-94 [Tanacetum cinerariifolium]